MSLESLLLTEEEQFYVNESITGKLNHINNIIQIKTKIDPSKYQNYIYTDIKTYIDLAIKCLDVSLFEYEIINRTNLSKLINMEDRSKQIYLYKYLARRLRQVNLVEEELWATSMAKKTELLYLIKEGWTNSNPFKNLLKLVLCSSSINVNTLAISLLLLFVIVACILLPAPFDSFAMFKVSYHKYFDSFYLNHFANMMSMFLDMKNDLKVEPINLCGFLLLAIFKILVVECHNIVDTFLCHDIVDTQHGQRNL